MAGVVDVSLQNGWLPYALDGLGIAGAGYLLFRALTRVHRKTVVLVVGVGGLVTAVLLLIVEVIWRPFPDPLSWAVRALVGVAVIGIAVAVAQFRGARWWRRIVAGLAAIVVLAATSNEINRTFGQYPTVRALLGLPLAHQAPLPPLVPPSAADSRTAPATGVTALPTALPTVPLVDRWTPPADQPLVGQLSEVTIAGTISGFTNRPAWVYLPPAYLTATRPALPVLVMLHGQPGAPRNWIDAGGLQPTMDAFAAAHHGLAPIVVMPDALGSYLANPICADSNIAKADTYLAADVPAWIEHNLLAEKDHRYWGVGGFSYGGTCSLQLATNHPATYPNFIDISGPDEPSLYDRATTVNAAFGGDEAAFLAINPLTILSKKTFPGSAGYITNAADLTDAVARVVAACQKAGMQITSTTLTGGHSWVMATTAFAQALPWFATRVKITP